MSVQNFAEKFDILRRAACPAVFVKTSEPLRAVDGLVAYASQFTTSTGKADPLPLAKWDVIRGFTASRQCRQIQFKAVANPANLGVSRPLGAAAQPTPAATNSVDPEWHDPIPGTNEAYTAVKFASLQNEGIYVFLNWQFANAPGQQAPSSAVQQELQYAVRNLPNTATRLVFIVPNNYVLPALLEDEVQVINFDVLNSDERVALIQGILDNTDADNRPDFSAEDVEEIVSLTAGMTKAECENAIYRTLTAASKKLREGTETRQTAVSLVLAEIGMIKIERINRSDVLHMSLPVDMSLVGGMAELKRYIANRRVAFTKAAAEAGVDKPKGITLVGPPGTGKSLAASAISSVLRIPLITFDLSRVFNSLVGSSETRIRDALRLVEQSAPCVLMIDEIDKVFQQSSSNGDSGVSQRVLGTLLTWMQNNSGVYVVMTANRTAGLPAELLRKGRVDEVFSVTLPNKADREAIIRIHLEKRRQNADLPDLAVAVNAAERYVPAEIEAAVKEAVLHAYRENRAVTGADIAAELRLVTPLSTSFSNQFTEMEEWARTNARPAAAAETELPAVQVPAARVGRVVE